jgi:hypothetical protein
MLPVGGMAMRWRELVLKPRSRRDFCCACGSTQELSRRWFLSKGVAAALASPALVAGSTPSAQPQFTVAQASDRPILVKNGCVISLDPIVGDFERADVLIFGSRIAAVGPNLSAARGGNHRCQSRDRHAGVHRHPSAHVGRHPAQHPSGCVPRRLRQHRADQARAALSPRGCLCG